MIKHKRFSNTDYSHLDQIDGTWESVGVIPAAKRIGRLSPREVVFIEYQRLKAELSTLVLAGKLEEPAPGYMLVPHPAGYAYIKIMA